MPLTTTHTSHLPNISPASPPHLPRISPHLRQVRVGDQMVSVNGERCTSPEQTASLLKEAEWTVAIEVVHAQAEPPAANKRGSFSKFGRNSFSPVREHNGSE